MSKLICFGIGVVIGFIWGAWSLSDVLNINK